MRADSCCLDHFPFLKLPGELRNRIYDLIFLECGAGPIICLWPSPLPPSFTSSIISGGSQESPANKTIDTAILMVNKEVGMEAASVYYAKRSFRFDSAQLANLFLMPQIFDCLQTVEIEDVLPESRRWPLVLTLDKLSAASRMQKIIIGTNLSGGSQRSLGSICDKARERWIELMNAFTARAYNSELSRHEQCEGLRLLHEHCAVAHPTQYMSLIWEAFVPDEFEFSFEAPSKISIVNLRKKVAYERKKERELQKASML